MEPVLGEQFTGTEPSTISEADCPLYVTTAPDELVASAIILEGTLTTGAVVSCTVTLKELVPVLPCASVAEQLTTLVPNGNVDPELGAQITGIEPSTISFAAWPE